MMRYCLFDPTKNRTILVETPVPVEQQPFVAEKLMALEPTAEQTGFVSMDAAGGDIALRMAGGEFCGNATMSAATLFCIRRGLEKAAVSVCAVGAKVPVAVAVEKLPDGIWRCDAQMPQVNSIEEVELPLNGDVCRLPLVRFDGIAHLIAQKRMERAAAEAAVKCWCRLLDVDALGLMLLSPDRKSLSPLVCVRNPQTLFWESSCASGTVAAGAYLAACENKTQRLSFAEPGGILEVVAEPGGSLRLRGNVRLEKTVELPL